MHVRFVYPRFNRPSESNPELADTVDADVYIATPSLSIAILASLTPPPHTFDFRDDRVEPPGYDDPVDLVAIPVFTPAAERAMEIAEGFRERGVKVVAGGIFATLMPEELASSFDAVVIGEGEPVWPQILADAEQGTLQPVYRCDRPWDVKQVQQVPRYDIYLDKYQEFGDKGLAGHLDLPCQISRGCPIVCDNCVIPSYMGHSVRLFPVEWVADCFRTLGDAASERGVCLTEDTSILPMPSVLKHFTRVVDACEGIGARISYIGVSPQFVLQAKPEFFAALRRMNTFQLYLVYGFDPLSHRAFAAKPDPKAVADAVAAVSRTYDEGLHAYCSMLMGHDHEDESVFDQILEFTVRADVRSAEFPILTPYPGTPMWKRLVGQGRILHRRWSRYNDANVVFQPAQYTPERLLEGYLHVWREFYKNKRSTALPIQV